MNKKHFYIFVIKLCPYFICFTYVLLYIFRAAMYFILSEHFRRKHFPVEEAWFPIVQSCLLGATNVYHKRLFVALSQSYQLYQMTYVKRQKSCWKQG